MRFNVEINDSSVILNGEKLKRKTTGSSRKIYLGKNYVVKIEDDSEYCDRWRLHQCTNEYELWKSLPKSERKYFVPILKYKHTEEYNYVIQPRLKLITKGSVSKIEKGFAIIYKLIKKYDFNDIMEFGDITNNWAFSNGQPIINDYGV